MDVDIEMSNYSCFSSEENGFHEGNLVYRTRDELGEILVVDFQQFRVLTFGSVYEQSRVDLNNPHILIHEYTRVMMMVLAFTSPNHATILGLGGGCLIRSLFHLLPDCELHIVELRHQVFQIATDYFGIPSTADLKVTISDAKHQLKNSGTGSTGVIFADMYHAYGMNPYQMQQRFVTHCHRVLDDRGWLVINYHQMPDVDGPFFGWLRGLFSDVLICPAESGNHILFATKDRLPAELKKFYPILEELENRMGVELTPLFERLVRWNRN